MVIFYTVKMLAIFPSPARLSLTKVSLAEKNLITVFPARESLDNDIPAGDGKIAFFTVYSLLQGPSVQFRSAQNGTNG